MKKKIIVDIIRYLFVILFLYTAWSKLSNYDAFRSQLGSSPVLATFLKSVAWVIPTCEIAIAVVLLIPSLKLTGLYAALGAMLLFTGYLIVLHRNSANVYLSCSCGGILETISWQLHILINICFALLGVTGIVFIRQSRFI